MPTLTLTLQTRIGLARAGHLANLRCTSDDGVVGGDDDVVRGPDLCNWARRVPLTLKASRRGRAHCCSHAAPRPECRLPIPLHGSVADALQRTVMRPWGPSSQIRVPGHEHDTNDKLQEMLITMLRGTSPQGSDAHEPPSLTPHGRKRWSFTCWNTVCGRPA